MLNDRSSGEEGRATRRLASDALSFAWLKRRVVRWIGETTCRLNGCRPRGRASFACERAAAKRQTTCRLRSGRTTCRSRPLEQDSHLTERRRFERAKRRRFASNPAAAGAFLFFLLRSSSSFSTQTSHLSQPSLTRFSLSSPPVRTVAGGKWCFLSPLLMV